MATVGSMEASGAVPLEAVIVSGDRPPVVGVPDSVQAAASSARPSGTVPVVTVQVGAGTPLVGKVKVKGVPTAPSGGVPAIEGAVDGSAGTNPMTTSAA